MATPGFYPGEATQDPIQDTIAVKKGAIFAVNSFQALYYQPIVLKNVNNVSFVI